MAEKQPVAAIPAGLLLQSALRKEEPPAPPVDGIDVTIDSANDNGYTTDPETGAISIETDDGGVIIDFSGGGGFLSDNSSSGKTDFNANLAEYIDAAELGRIAGDLLRGIQFDDASRREWLQTRAEGIRILGLSIETPRSSIDTTTALEGMSNVRHPMLLEATLRFQANARGELLPSDGPVKVADKLTETGESNLLAEKLEEDLNYYLTSIATEYYPDTDRLLLFVGFGGCMFKKVYFCPLRQRPVSESVDAKDLIVSNAATDMRNSGRTTQVIPMRPSVLKRMQLAGAYRDVPLSSPVGVTPNPVDQQIADTQGIQLTSQQTEDRDYTIYECYCELNLKGYEHKDEDGNVTGLPLPYRVVIEKDSQQILEIRRNWREEDESCMAKICFVKYPFVPGLGFYDIGLIHILGNTTNALTAAWRELLDAGMFANFPGFLYSKLLGRQNTNEFRVPPGGGAPIDTNGMPITDAVMPLPYKDVSTAFAQFIENIAQTGARVGGTAEVNIAEGKQDAPVGTTLALIEQATKVEGAVHKRLHAAQAEEFQLLKECFRENPQSFIRAMSVKGETDWSEEGFVAALNDASLVPMADPNTPSHMHRLMKAMGLIQLDKAYPGIMDPRKLVQRVTHMMGVDDIDSLMAPQGGQPGMPPELMVKLKELEDKEKEREHKTKMQLLEDQNEVRQHQHEMQVQQLDSADRKMEAQTDLKLGELDFFAANRTAQADVLQERIRAEATVRQSQDDVKIAEHGVKEAKEKVRGDQFKAKAVAKKAAARPAPKKRN